jgi:hypothetical protein
MIIEGYYFLCLLLINHGYICLPTDLFRLIRSAENKLQIGKNDSSLYLTERFCEPPKVKVKDFRGGGGGGGGKN